MSTNALNGKRRAFVVIFMVFTVITLVSLFMREINGRPNMIGSGSLATGDVLPEWKRIDKESLTNLVEQSHSIVDAYTNSNIEVIERKFKELLEKSLVLDPVQYAEIYGAISHSLWQSFLTPGFDCCSLGRKEFLNYVKASQAVIALFELGDIRRNLPTEQVFYMENQYLQRLCDFKSYFGKHGHSDLCHDMDALITEWIERMDSTSGISYSYVQWQYKVNLEFVAKKLMTREKAVKVTRYWMVPFERLVGRPPKWIDEIK